MRLTVMFILGTLFGLALSRSDIGAQLAEMVQQGIHFLVG